VTWTAPQGLTTVQILLVGGGGLGAKAKAVIDQGEIKFNGTRIDHLNEDELMKFRIKISYSFQSGALFDSINVFMYVLEVRRVGKNTDKFCEHRTSGTFCFSPFGSEIRV
jgi:ABC-type transporter Mla maintaining outer membrane lipid asymmetry ATPase subunit MlaF